MKDTVGVRPKGDGIEVRFKWNGKTMRPCLSLKATKANLLHAARVREKVVAAIEAGTFDMLEFFPNYKFAEKVKLTAPTESRTVQQWFDAWVAVSKRTLEHSTLAIYQRHMKAYWLPKFGAADPTLVTNEMILRHLADLAEGVNGKKGLARKTQNNILIPMRGVFEMIGRAPGAGPNPCEGVENLAVQQGAPDPFTVEEVDIALARILKSYGQVWHDYFEFSAYAGLRASEQIALLWDDVDLRSGTLVVRRAKVLTKTKARTKTNKERTVELNDRALAVIERQRARTQMKGQQVFWNPSTDHPFHDEQSQRRVWTQVLCICGIRHRPPKELRDSSVTFDLLAGADPWYVAQQHGHSLQTMLKDYAKWIPGGDRGRNRQAINSALGETITPRNTAERNSL